MSALSGVCTRLAALVLILPVLAACGLSPAPASTPVPPTVPPTSTSVPTDTPVPTSTPGLLLSVPLNTPEASALTSQVDDYVNELVQGRTFSGSVLLARDGKVLVSKGYGMADVANGTPNTPQTQFRIASLTKAFTAMSIMMLKERGKLSVSDSICKYLEGCPAAWQPVTLRHLLTHTSGVPDFAFAPSLAVTTTLRELVDQARDKPLDSEAGAEYLYNNFGYILLGQVIEEVSGQPYPDFVTHNILQPLGMVSSSFDETSLGRFATGYSEPDKPARNVFPPVVYAAGGLVSTVEDMYRWSQVYYIDKLVSMASIEEMFTPATNTRYGSYGYGYGWGVDVRPFGTAMEHGGAMPGYVSFLSLYPDSKTTIVMLSNYELANTNAINSMLASLMFR